MVTDLLTADPLVGAIVASVSIGLIVILAEWLHSRRIGRISYLAFGAMGEPRSWTKAAPWIRVIGTSLAAFGLTVLALQEPRAIEKEPAKEASKHLLVCLDASPSMYVEDSGPSGKEKRAIWAGEVVQAILDRLDTETTRVTVFAVYTKSIPVIEETFDRNVVRNLLDGLPLYAAFTEGPTRLSSGVSDALDYARRWKPNSATLVIISDGDTEEKTSVRFVPPSIADTIVIGVGDPSRPTIVNGHRSTQDTASLKSLAQKLQGVYHQGNSKHLPTGIISKLEMIRPRVSDQIGLREIALICIGVGTSLLVSIGPALMLLGKRTSDLRGVGPLTKGASTKGTAETSSNRGARNSSASGETSPALASIAREGS